MDKFSILDLVLDVDANTLAHDPYIRDMQYQPLSEEILSDVYKNTIYKLEGAGFYKEYDIKLISQYSFNFSIPGIKNYTDKFCPDKTVFLLTFSANGMHFITPPYEEGSHAPMSWNEWALRIYNEEKQLPLLIRAPWAQAKFINVGAEC